MPERTVDYTYDALGRLVQETIASSATGMTTATSTYDAVGNRLTHTVNGRTTSSTYDANDRLLSTDTAHYTYDANGQTLQRTAPTGTTQYRYDAAQRLEEIGVGVIIHDPCCWPQAHWAMRMASSRAFTNL